MKKQRKPRGNQERWMVSYADFMTLLFAVSIS
jgi:flagellar motor protein MotB